MRQVFPRTFALLSETQAWQLEAQFLGQFSQQQLHFFPMWLKEQKKALSLIQCADYEYLKFAVQTEERASLSHPRWHWHSSVRLLLFTAGAEALGKVAGVYALWKCEENFCERILNQEELTLMEALNEDLPIDPASIPNYEKNLQEFLRLGIIQAPTL